MGLYSDIAREDDELIDMDSLVEAFLIDDLTHNFGEDTIKEFCSAGGVGEALLEAKVLSGPRTMMRISKKDDLTRRITITAIQIARQKKDPLYDKLVKYQKLRKLTKQKIIDKYGSRASRLAVKGQKAYIKTMKSVNLSNSGSGAFLTEDPNR